MNKKRKVLLIGADGFSMDTGDLFLKCFKWDSLKNIGNLRDYDVVILCLLDLTEKSRNEIDWDTFSSLLSFPDARDILQNGGRFFVVGDPRFSIPMKGAPDEGTNDIPFLRWSGFRYRWDSAAGDTINRSDGYQHRFYEEYSNHFKKWDYSLSQCGINSEVLEEHVNIRKIESNEISPDYEKDHICWNRYNNDLVFSLRLVFTRGRERIISFGPITFLPAISKPTDETIQIILRDLCGVEADLPEPEWLENFVVPGQARIDKNIQSIKDQINNLHDNLEQEFSTREKARECLKLLFEREYSLEPAVRNVLRNLGVHVEDPEENNKEDGWISIDLSGELLEGVLEIKSTKNDTFGEEGRKQLLDWIDRGRTLREKEYKGVFIGNSAVNKPANKRPWPFSDSWTKAATLSRICAITTKDLYLIYILHSQDKLDSKVFWNDLFKTNGIFNMKPYYELLKEKDDA